MREGQMHLLRLVHRRASTHSPEWLIWKGASVACANLPARILLKVGTYLPRCMPSKGNYSYTKGAETRCLVLVSSRHIIVNPVVPY